MRGKGVLAQIISARTMGWNPTEIMGEEAVTLNPDGSEKPVPQYDPGHPDPPAPKIEGGPTGGSRRGNPNPGIPM